jgi:alanine-synthesizing transaminase
MRYTLSRINRKSLIDKLIEVAKDPKTHRYPDSSGMKNLKKEIPKYYKMKKDSDRR